MRESGGTGQGASLAASAGPDAPAATASVTRVANEPVRADEEAIGNATGKKKSVTKLRVVEEPMLMMQ